MKRALITGAAGGLGNALTEHLAHAGWSVVAAWHSKPVASEGLIAAVQIDVTDARSVEAGFAELGAEAEHLDLLVNNAGVTVDAPFLQLKDDDWQRVLDVSLKGAFLCARAAKPMLAKRGGHIINISSFAARAGTRGQSAYAAAKAGLIALTQTIAIEFAPEIRANAVLPGVLPTAMTERLTESHREALADSNVLKRLNDLDEVCRFIEFLASTRNVSGQVFQLDSRIARWT